MREMSFSVLSRSWDSFCRFSAGGQVSISKDDCPDTLYLLDFNRPTEIKQQVSQRIRENDGDSDISG